MCDLELITAMLKELGMLDDEKEKGEKDRPKEDTNDTEVPKKGGIQNSDS